MNSFAEEPFADELFGAARARWPHLVTAPRPRSPTGRQAAATVERLLNAIAAPFERRDDPDGSWCVYCDAGEVNIWLARGTVELFSFVTDLDDGPEEDVRSVMRDAL